MMSCQIGLGDEVDLEAPEITLSEMISGDTIVDSSHFGAGVYCRKKVTFKGTATDNKAIDKVYAEIKWSDQEDFSYYADATLEGNNFTFNFDLENQNTICSIPNSVPNDYSPKFEVTHKLLPDITMVEKLRIYSA